MGIDNNFPPKDDSKPERSVEPIDFKSLLEAEARMQNSKRHEGEQEITPEDISEEIYRMVSEAISRATRDRTSNNYPTLRILGRQGEDIDQEG